jgi:glycosyltransferase involved in cell wall biosynthesis
MKAIVNAVCFLIPIASIRRPLRARLHQRWTNHKNNPWTFARGLTGRPIILWIDHALGGGTEVYSKRQFKILGKKFDVLRLQYFPKTELYHLTFACNRHRIWTTYNIDAIADFLCELHIEEIVVNNLVAYKSTTDMLRVIAHIKQNCLGRVTVSFRGHDFQSICPSFNLMNCNGNYCDLCYSGGCEDCWRRKKLSDNPISHNVLKSGATSICIWRSAWGKFFADIADEVILFAEPIAKIFLRAYPDIQNKIKIIPHTVRNYRRAKIRPHDDINIVVLGNISLQKGAGVICDMANHLSAGTNIIIVGNMKNAPDNIFVHGKYNANRLPRLMEKYRADIVFIPSIWPETFSYTTSEAMSMGLPIACFDMGAPAQRVGEYERGLVLSEINPEKNLAQIIEFIKRMRGTAK